MVQSRFAWFLEVVELSVDPQLIILDFVHTEVTTQHSSSRVHKQMGNLAFGISQNKGNGGKSFSCLLVYFLIRALENNLCEQLV